MIIIREELPLDIERIREINDAAFNQPNEGLIVDRIRESCTETLSLVAVQEEKIVGHIFFSPVEIETQSGMIKGMGLAPMAVAPDHQNQGIGSQLVNEGLKIIKERKYPFVIALGHPDYYPRFGFMSAPLYGLKCQWEGVPDEAFMAMIFEEKKWKVYRVRPGTGTSSMMRCRFQVLPSSKNIKSQIASSFHSSQ